MVASPAWTLLRASVASLQYSMVTSLVGVNAVLGQDERRTYSGVAPLPVVTMVWPLQIPDRVDGLSVLDDVEHAQRVDAGNFHCTVRLVVERGGKVGGHSGGVQVSP